MTMTLVIPVRRILVVVGVIAALVIGGLSIHVASEWTAASAPLEVQPASLNSLQAALMAEQERSANLQVQLTTIGGAAGDLTVALDAASGQMVDDTTSAAALRQNLAAAQAKLAKLEATMAASARAARAAALAAAAGTAGKAAGSSTLPAAPSATPEPTLTTEPAVAPAPTVEPPPQTVTPPPATAPPPTPEPHDD